MTTDTKPLVSIIIPCFSAERWVRDAIESALAQTHAPCEVIVVDDGSTDGTRGILESFGPRIRLLAQPHAGACAARNRGIKEARGEFIQFLDADDALDAQKIEIMLDAVRSHPDALVFCDYRIQQEENSPSMWTDQSPYRGEDPVEFILKRQLTTPAVLHRKSRLQDIGGFDTELPCAQEFDLHLRMACRGAPLHHVPQSLVTVRKHLGGISHSLIRVLDQYPRILQRAAAELEERGALTENRRQALAQTMAWGARQLLKRGETGKSIAYFRKARTLHPNGGLSTCGRFVRLLHRGLGPALACRIMAATHRVVAPSNGQEAPRRQSKAVKKIVDGLIKRWKKFHGATLRYLTNHVVSRCLCSSFRLFWYRRVMGFEIGAGSSILIGCRFAGRGNLRIGEGTVINSDCRLDNREPLRIGDHVSISAEVLVLTGGHDMDSPWFAYRGGPVVIEDYVWVCARAIIQPGVTLGRGAVVLPGSVVTKTVPPRHIMGGVPARFVKERTASLSYTINWNPTIPPLG